VFKALPRFARHLPTLVKDLADAQRPEQLDVAVALRDAGSGAEGALGHIRLRQNADELAVVAEDLAGASRTKRARVARRTSTDRRVATRPSNATPSRSSGRAVAGGGRPSRADVSIGIAALPKPKSDAVEPARWSSKR
jgi:hypothetical protein